MKKISVIVLMVVSLAFAGFAEAAKPKKRTRNANRVGAYGGVLIGQGRYSGDHSEDEQDLVDTLANQNVESRNITSSTKDSGIGYQAAFGYRFNRYFAAELGLAQYGELKSTAKGELNFVELGGFVPASLSYTFNVGGPVLSAVGILPIGDKFEVYGRLGYLFASSERQISSRLDGQSGGVGTAKGDSQEPVFGIGMTYHINQVYSIRGEYQKIGKVGQETRTGTEELDVIGLGITVRF
jgi:OOP family OmpA-OmpF porin